MVDLVARWIVRLARPPPDAPLLVTAYTSYCIHFSPMGETLSDGLRNVDKVTVVMLALKRLAVRPLMK